LKQKVTELQTKKFGTPKGTFNNG